VAATQRVLVAFCPDWPVIAFGRAPSSLVAVIGQGARAKEVVAASPAASAAGVRARMRLREAQCACPGLEVLERDEANEVRKWEPAVAAVEVFAPEVEVLAPGLLALAAKGPARYFGGEAALAAKVVAAVEAAVLGEEPEPGPGSHGPGRGCGSSRFEDKSGCKGRGGLRSRRSPWLGCCRVGVADGLFAAGVAACIAGPGGPLVVKQGAAGEFLGPLPLAWLASARLAGWGVVEDGFADLVDLLERLGLKTLGEFAALPTASVLGRFGRKGADAQLLAQGLLEQPVRGRRPPPDLVVEAELGQPADQLEAVVFVARALAEQLHQRLSVEGLACTLVAIEVETEQRVRLRRSWRHEGALGAAAIGERARWQLEAWSQGGSAGAGRVTRVALMPEEVRPDKGRQLGFWGEDPAAGERAARALARVQAVLGPDGALTAVLQGGRDYSEQVRLVPWGEPRELAPAGAAAPRRRTATHVPMSSRPPSPVPAQPPSVGLAAAKVPEGSLEQLAGVPPWPGRLPGLAPAVVYKPPLPVEVLDAVGNPVVVEGRGFLSALPATVVLCKKGCPLAVTAWAGPWPLEEHWWVGGGRRRAWLQVVLVGNSPAQEGQEARSPGHEGWAYLLAREKGKWWAEAAYD
jgi:protein ImuB